MESQKRSIANQKRNTANQERYIANLQTINDRLIRLSDDYCKDLEVAIQSINTGLEDNLIKLAEECGHDAVGVIVDATAGMSEYDLKIDLGPYPSIYEAFDCARIESEDA
jgi:hypothetical protein